MADTDPAIATLTKQLVELSAALTRAEERAKASAAASKENADAKKREAAEAEKLSSKLADAARAATGIAEASKTSSAAALTLGNAFASLAREGITAAVSALEEWVRNLPEAAARNERHAAAVRRLGDAWGAVQHATNGAVSAEQAAAVQQRVAQAGIQLTARELAAVTQRAREYALATGGDLGQALEQLSDQLVQPGEELAKFGIRLRQGMGEGDKLREALRQLTQQAETGARSQLTLTESMEAATRAQREASDAVSGLLAQKLQLADFFTQLTSWLNDAKDSTDGWKTATDALAGTLREVAGLQLSAEERARNGQAPNQSASGAFIEQAGPLMQRARQQRGLNFHGFQMGHLGVDATPEQRARVLAMLQRAVGGQLNQQALDLELQGYEAEVGATAATRADDAAAASATAQRNRRHEIQRRNQAGASPSTAAADGQLLTVGSDAIAAIVDGLVERAGGRVTRPDAGMDRGVARAQSEEANRRETERMEQQRSRQQRERASTLRGFDRQDLTDQVDTQNTRSQLALADSQARAAEAGRATPFSAAARTQAAEERARIQILREQGAALRELYQANVALEEQQRAAGATQAELNGIIQQRIGLQTALAQNTRELADSQVSVSRSLQDVGSKLIDTLGGTADAMGEAVAAAIEGSKSFGDSMHAMVYEALRALTKLAVVEAIKETAMGLAAFATYRYDAMAAHFASAGTWAGVGLAAGLGLAAMPNPNAAKPSGPAQGGSDRSASADRSARADDTRGGGPLVLNFNVSGAAFTDAGVQHAAAAAVRGAAANGFLTSSDLRGLS